MKFPTVIRNHKRLFAVGVLILLGLAVASFILLTNKKSKQQTVENQKYYSVLTGEEVEQGIAEAQILAVMVENSELARPQSGLDSAGIVFETTTEGGITRYLALYDKDYPEDIAPVRSVRPAFVDWLMGFDAAVAHVGGSAQALEMLKERKAKDLDQFMYPDSYFRGNERVAPHNMHVRTADLIQLMKDLEYSTSDVEPFIRGSNVAAEQPDATEITVSFSTPEFATKYKYDESTNSYVRYLAGEPHIDTLTGEPIMVTNVVVLQMGQTINSIGTGKATVFMNGTVVTGAWRQDSFNDRLKLYVTQDGQEQEIALNVGDSWIAAIPNSGSLDY